VVEHRRLVVLARDYDSLVPDARKDDPLAVHLGSKAFLVHVGKGVPGAVHMPAPVAPANDRDELACLLVVVSGNKNDQPLSFRHGAPLRLRNEIELGFKQVKWIKGIEFVADFYDLGSSYGGYNQDHEFFGYRQSI